MSQTATHLYLIRHGQAVGNVEPIIGSIKGDTGLTELGVRQAERLRDRLAAGDEIGADILLASTMPRARQTAEIIAPALAVPIIWDDDLQEMRAGEADGLSVEEYRRRFGLPDFWDDPYRLLAPGGESWVRFVARATGALHRIVREHQGQRIVAVCHGGIVDASFVYFLRLNALFPGPIAFYTENTSITHWDVVEREGHPPRWRLRGYNDVAHLRGLNGQREP